MDVKQTTAGRKVVLTVFLALLIDLLAFTIPLPLFPRLIAWYLHREAHDSSTLLSRLLNLSYQWRSSLAWLAPSGRHSPVGSVGEETKLMWSHGAEGVASGGKNWDVVLLGGAMGSLFSLCQCIISPWLGGLSDKYGRKRILLATMVGNLLSAFIWLRSTTFSSYLLSRLVGGLSEGNVQLSTAIISDVTTPETRSKSLALVGIAFSVCFTLGPSLGAYFASRPLPLASASAVNKETWNVYALPAAISLVLLLVETGFLAVSLPETRWWKSGKAAESKVADGKVSNDGADLPSRESAETRFARLRTAGRLHGLFLLFFSGAEFTLTFLTFDLFGATNAQNGRLLSYIGILSAMLQARHVRPSLARIGEFNLASFGIMSCMVALSLLALLPSIASSSTLSTVVLYSAATMLSYTSATVVTSLTAAAASCCDEDTGMTVPVGTAEVPADPRLRRGRALGGFRSRGQLGRAIGPLLVSSVYWMMGPTVAYTGMLLCMSAVGFMSLRPTREENLRKHARKAK